MAFRTFTSLLLVLALVTSACSRGISAETCDEVVDETMTLLQRLIDDVDAEFSDMSVEEFIASGGDLPSIEQFQKDADTIDAIAAELGCTQSEISSGVADRVDELTATTDLGRFLIGAIRSGGI